MDRLLDHPLNDEVTMTGTINPDGTIGCVGGIHLKLEGAAKAGKKVEGSGTAKNVIYVYLSGGLSHIDSLDPKPGAPTAGEFKPVKTNVDGIQLSQHMNMLADQMDHCTVIRSMTSKQGAHERGRYLMHNAMRHALGQPRSDKGFEKIDPKLKKYLNGVLDTLDS